jgi:adenine-specific DNA-methyltransferase
VPEDRDGQSHIVKYHRLESYEDALNNVVLEEPTDEEQQTFTQNQRDAYVSGYMLGFESEGASLIEPASFEQPFDHELDIERKGVGREPVAVDLVETFHYLVGADVHQFETYEHQDREYVVTECSVERENGVDSVLTVWRDARDLNLEQEREWVAEELEREQFDQMYINSESAVPRAEPVEVTFKTRMEATNDDTE